MHKNYDIADALLRSKVEEETLTPSEFIQLVQVLLPLTEQKMDESLLGGHLQALEKKEQLKSSRMDPRICLE